ncbi:hypothetical protein IGI04_008911 [Brassica rapa subsp. trilocularis]|uniref:Replication factor A C-terminal domain-containing protein n=1 Tax=Brassica rapa subsp. trilocularis TaxID=1813537 RepID=A0ABQ7MVR4_BRACM|nr:hypothetical protein IGI04_008911 [Brassica rapa subsp. trilocularis]
MAMKRNGKSIVSSDFDDTDMFFKDVSLGHHKSQLRFRLLHFWEAWNPIKKTLIGLEMLLIDEQGTVIQGFISPGRIQTYLKEMKRGYVYKLNNFYGSRNKTVFRVSDHTATVSFAWNSELSVLQDGHAPFDEDSFRFYSYEEFQASCDLKGDLYVFLLTLLMNYVIYVVGHMKLGNGQSIKEAPVLDEVEIAKARHVLIHIQSHDLCFLIGFLDTLGTLSLTSMSSSRVFMDYDVQPTIDYFGWLGSNPAIAEQVSAEVVTKRETMTIGEIFSYIKQESAKDAFFECTATINDVVHDSGWYYIACSGCNTKVTNGATSMICTNIKCEKINVAGVAQYRSKISVYDNSEQAFFVLLGDAGRELTGKPASELVRNYFEANGNEEEHNLSGKTRSLTVTKILPLDTPPATMSSEEDHTTATSEEAFKRHLDSAEGSKRTCDSDEIEESKRLKCGN